MPGGITLKASIVIRARATGRFPAASYAAALSPARASLARDTERAFATKADPVTGRAWPRRKYKYPHAPLVKTGDMKRGTLRAIAAARVTGSSLAVAVKEPKYAAYQQRGTKTISARRFVGASIGTVRIVQAALVREGREQAVRVLRGK